MVSLFAFIVTLGIVVDDAIIVGENIFEKPRARRCPRSRPPSRVRSEISGPRRVRRAHEHHRHSCPCSSYPARAGNIFRQIPAVVVSVFVISLLESLYILPAHLAHEIGEPGRIVRVLGAPNRLGHAAASTASATAPCSRLWSTWSLRNRYLRPRARRLGLLAPQRAGVDRRRAHPVELPAHASTPTSRRPPRGSRSVSRSTTTRGRPRRPSSGRPARGRGRGPGTARARRPTPPSADLLAHRERRGRGGPGERARPCRRCPRPARGHVVRSAASEFNREWRRVGPGTITGVEALTFSASLVRGPAASRDRRPADGPGPGPASRTRRASSPPRLRTSTQGVSDIDDGTASGQAPAQRAS